jgi:hypothetical protein
VNSFLKKASSLLESIFLQPLITGGYLVGIPNGRVCRKSKVIVYVKMLPTVDDESKKTFIERLASFHDEWLNNNTYMTSCKTILLNTMGVISEEVLEIIRLEVYQSFKLNLAPLFQRVENEYDGRNRGKAFNFECIYQNDICIFFYFRCYFFHINRRK